MEDNIVGLSSRSYSQRSANLDSIFAYQARLVLRSFSRNTHETSSSLLQRKQLGTPREHLRTRAHNFMQRQQNKDPAEFPIIQQYLDRVQQIHQSIFNMDEPEIPSNPETIICQECGLEFNGAGPLRRHLKRVHPETERRHKGPKFEPKFHAIPSTSSCRACHRAFRKFFQLRKHGEASNCPKQTTLCNCRPSTSRMRAHQQQWINLPF